MPEGLDSSGKSRRRDPPSLAVESWLSGIGAAARPLVFNELRAYPGRGFLSGWRIDVAFPDRVRRLDILIDKHFPYEPPRIALVDRPDFLTWPHFEQDGIMCLLPGGAEVDSFNPQAVVENLLASASRLIEDSVDGRNQSDFRDEFLSYWNWTATSGAISIRSLINPEPPTRLVRIWRGQEFYLVADSEPELLAWLERAFSQTKPQKISTEDALFLWIGQPLMPCEYPKTAADVFALVQTRTADGVKLIAQLVADGHAKIVVLLAASTSNGPCLAGLTIWGPDSGNKGRHSPIRPLTRGFRPQNMPQQLLSRRFFGETPVVRARAERVDPAWIHGRGQDANFARLRAESAAVLGCGSVGASVALMLAEAGVGRILLVDPERLTWSNVGRHPLGASSVDKYKSNALSSRILSDYPHIISVTSENNRWEDLEKRSKTALESCDLIVSTMGDWAAEGALNDWHLSKGRRHPIVYGWTEAHACAGQAVAVTGSGGCFHCGVSNTGLPFLRVTEWPEGLNKHQEPACGAVYQSYGPVALAYVVALIAELAIDCLLGRISESTHRIWAARRSLLEGAGGRWSEDWLGLNPGRLEGGFLIERPWPRLRLCDVCRAEAA
jgi:sulfur-carrier protein adenylyltransferase/sulfurtransferase